MGYPNLVIDGKGRFIVQRVLEYSQQREVQQSDLHLLDEQKTAIKVVKDGVAVSETFDILIFNDEIEDKEITVEFLGIMPLAWTFQVTYAGIVRTSPFDITVLKRNFAALKVEIFSPVSSLVNQLGNVILKAYLKNNEDISDMCCASLGTIIATYADVELRFEQFVKDTGVFPPGVYTAQQVIEEYLKVSSENVYKAVSTLWKRNITKIETAKSYVILFAILHALVRTGVYAYTGAGIWTESLRLIKDEMRELKEQLGD